MDIAKMLNKALGKSLELGHCMVEIESSNGVEPKIELLRDGLQIEPFCRCGESQGTFQIDDKSSLIIERAKSDLAQQDRQGLVRNIQLDESTVIPCNCNVCGREFHVTAVFILSKAWIKKFDERYTHGHQTVTYGGCLEIEVEIKNGYFEAENRQSLILSEVLSPKHACTVELNLPRLRQATEDILQAISNYWEKDEEPQPRHIHEKVKCMFCLREATVKATLTPKLPSKSAPISEIIKKYRGWMERIRT